MPLLGPAQHPFFRVNPPWASLAEKTCRLLSKSNTNVRNYASN